MLNIPEGLHARPEVVEVPVPDFGWFTLPPDIIQALLRPEGIFVLGAVPIIPAFDWLVQESDVFKAPPRPEGLTARLDPVAPPIVFLEWFQIQENPRIRRPWLLGDVFRPLIVIGAPVPDLVFTIRICLNLSELEINRLLPDPSGFIKPLMELPDPSGYEADEDTVNSLAALAKEELPPPSGFVAD